VTEEEAIALVTGIVCRGRHLDPSQISATTNLVEEVGFDSLDAAELLAALYQETGLQLDVDSIKDIKTVGDIARGLLKLAGSQKVS
jgi:acyl carrier protein